MIDPLEGADWKPLITEQANYTLTHTKLKNTQPRTVELNKYTQIADSVHEYTDTHSRLGIFTQIVCALLAPAPAHTCPALTGCVYMPPSLGGLARGIEGDQKRDQQKAGPGLRVNK